MSRAVGGPPPQRRKRREEEEEEEEDLSSSSLFSLPIWSGRVLVCGLRDSFIHLATRQMTREYKFPTGNVFPCLVLSPGPTVRPCQPPGFCWAFIFSFWFLSLLICLSPFLFSFMWRLSLDSRRQSSPGLCLTSAAPDPPVGGLLRPLEPGQLPPALGVRKGMSLLLTVRLPGHEGSYSCLFA